ncbi:phage tail protein [Novosphingobium mangrovi (ex Huang et al. 2023)]|uniref:Phage tail protein n=1 Tax=Novosphingobium mangrovi (ex Huang et al. 2023) TaxID=2976432 RepID=A0ABT2I163_9SPHN|nr:phage tail protein [Novosphingobium mangrovi (ex Huang et al. 2023)]MCT2398535.1 phage tail protein [Novosphingobium mangrovi (ex Huang et al. 2023)]
MPIEKIVLTVALAAANYGLQASQRIKGPRLQDTQFTGGDPGAPRWRFWGTWRHTCTAIYGEELFGVEREAKTKGGKVNNTTYFGSWDVDVACHEISAVTRMWFDTHLVYDVTGAGPVTPFEIGYSEVTGKNGSTSFRTVSLPDHMRIYLGGEDQEPDPDMEAAIDAQFGEGSTPAYRGTAHISFRDVPLEKFGNRIPQVTVEAIRDPGATYPKQTEATGISVNYAVSFSQDGSRLLLAGNGQYEVWDTVTRIRMISGPMPELPATGSLAPASNGGWYMLYAAGGNFWVYRIAADGLGVVQLLTSSDIAVGQSAIKSCIDGAGATHWMTIPYTVLLTFFFDGAELTTMDLCGIAFSPQDLFSDDYGDVWIVGAPLGTTTLCYFYRIVNNGQRGGPDLIEVMLPSEYGNPHVVQAWHYKDAAHDHFVLGWSDAKLHAIDMDNGSVLFSSVGGLPVPYTTGAGGNTVWVNGGSSVSEYSLADFSQIRIYETNSSDDPWGVIDHSYGIPYDSSTHALLALDGGFNFTWLSLDRVAPGATTLRTIVEDICTQAGIDSAQVDATGLTQEITGFGVTTGTGKDWLEPLLTLYDVDCRPNGFALEFVQRGGSAGETIAADDFARPGDASEPFSRTAGSGGTDLPRTVVLKFADATADQQPNSALSGPVERADGTREQVIDMSNLALTPDEARQLVARYHRRLYFEGRPAALALPASRLTLQPAARHPIAFDTVTRDARLHSMVLGADGRIDTEWRDDDPSIALLDGASGASLDGHRPQEIVVPAFAKGFVLDIPLIRDADSSASPVVYAAAAPYAEGAFTGATIWRAVSGEYTDELAAIAASAAATWGVTTDALGDVASPWVWDRGNTVNVRLQSGTLSGTTGAAIDANPAQNLAALIAVDGTVELLNFTTATLEGDGSYTLSGFKRGRRGTEWATGIHATGDVFLLLGTVAVAKPLDLSLVSTSQSFKAAANGRSLSSAFEIPMDPFNGASLMPRAPVHLHQLKLENGDIAMEGTRRTRVGGLRPLARSRPLSENSEEYEIEILDGATVVRTVTALSSPSYTYAEADQITDFGGAQSSVAWRMYQISDAVGRGFAAAA